MSEAYEIGVTLGMGVAAGVVLAGVLAPRRYGLAGALVGAVVLGLVAGWLVHGWLDIPGAVIGGLLGSASASVIVRGAVRRGATTGATAFLLVGAAIVIGAISLIPLVGYVVAVGAPGFAIRKVRSEPERYAGLRTLAK